MQIHEITKGPQRTDEGILDDLKAAVTATKTGYAAGKEGGGGVLGGLKGVAKNLTSRTAYNQALQQNARASTNKRIDKLEKSWGTQIKRPLSYYTDQLQHPTKPEFKPEAEQAKQQRDQLDQQFTQTFVAQGPGDVLPDPGKALVVILNGGKYYKTVNGKWYNEIGKQLPDTSYKALEALIDQDQYKQTSIPASVPGGAPAAPVNPGKAKPAKNAAQVNQQATVKEAQVAPQPGSLSRRAATRNAPVAPATAPVAAAPAKKKGRANLKTDFGDWIASRMGTDYKTIIASPTVKSELTKIFTTMSAQKDPKILKQLFDKYVLTAQAAVLKSKVESGLEDQEQSTTDDDLSQFKGQPAKKTGNQQLDQFLQQAGIPLSEGQVAITQDIVVKTKSGDYVKRHSDQKWYDPNGVWIDEEKYPDFVKRLDNTTQAQTRYQADAEKDIGSDVGLEKAKIARKAKAEADAMAKKAAEEAARLAPPPPPPQATAADWEEYRAEQNRINNAMIDKTVSDLRNSEYFSTGQEHYLQQQLLQQMGKKF